MPITHVTFARNHNFKLQFLSKNLTLSHDFSLEKCVYIISVCVKDISFDFLIFLRV